MHILFSDFQVGHPAGTCASSLIIRIDFAGARSLGPYRPGHLQGPVRFCSLFLFFSHLFFFIPLFVLSLPLPHSLVFSNLRTLRLRAKITTATTVHSLKQTSLPEQTPLGACGGQGSCMSVCRRGQWRPHTVSFRAELDIGTGRYPAQPLRVEPHATHLVRMHPSAV